MACESGEASGSDLQSASEFAQPVITAENSSALDSFPAVVGRGGRIADRAKGVRGVSKTRAGKARRPGAGLSHVDQAGHVRMVDVGGKPETAREAVARGSITVGPAALRQIRERRVAKGDPLQAPSDASANVIVDTGKVITGRSHG